MRLFNECPKLRNTRQGVATRYYKASALITLYLQLILPHIDYSDIWGNTYHTNLMPPSTLQKRVVRIICGIKARDHINILFINLKFKKCFDLIEYKTSVLMCTVKYKLLPIDIILFYSNEDSLHNTRQRDK